MLYYVIWYLFVHILRIVGELNRNVQDSSDAGGMDRAQLQWVSPSLVGMGFPQRNYNDNSRDLIVEFYEWFLGIWLPSGKLDG